MSITYSECMSVPIVIQLAVRVPRMVASSVACMALPRFSTLSHKRGDFWGGGEEKVVEREMCVLILSTTLV